MKIGIFQQFPYPGVEKVSNKKHLTNGLSCRKRRDKQDLKKTETEEKRRKIQALKKSRKVRVAAVKILIFLIPAFPLGFLVGI